MKEKLFCLLLGLSMALSLHASDWATDLVTLNPGVIDKVTYLPSTAYGPKWLRSYMIEYHQPLQHDAPELGNVPLRALLSVRYQEDFTHQMTQMHIGGYDLSNKVITYPNYYANQYYISSLGELAGRYGGNLLQVEHRYFGESCPNAPWATVGYCEAKEAAADFHALIEAMKKVFKGKWAITGVSKGGTTTAIQQALYPEDADCFVPYSGPFLDIEGDTRMQEYCLTEACTPEIREEMLHIKKEMLNRPDIYPLFRDYYWGPESYGWDKLLRCYFLDAAESFNYDLYAYASRVDVEVMIANSHSYLEHFNLTDYTDEMLLYMMVNNTAEIDEKYDNWVAESFLPAKGSDRSSARQRYKGQKHTYVHHAPLPVFSISPQEWDPSLTGYYYQAMHELGYFDLKWDYYYDTKAEADSVNALWRSQTINVLALGNSTFNDVVFDPTLLEEVRNATRNSQSKMLFIYGSDDFWTGARMDDDCVNGDNVRQYVLPAQNHAVYIYGVTDRTLRNEIWNFTDAIFAAEEESISGIQADKSEPTHFYDLYGRRLSPNALQNKLVIKSSR